MHKISRTSLAAIVCPSAPFLAPRLLRAAAPRDLQKILTASCAALHRNSYATKAQDNKAQDNKVEGKKRGGNRLSGRERWERAHRAHGHQDEVSPLLGKMRKACDLRDIQSIVELYPALLETRRLDRQDTRRIAQALHTRARQKAKTSDLFPFVQQVVNDLRSGALQPHPYAFVHLLGICRDQKRFNEGHDLWQWLVQQDNTYVSQAAYGVAIELLAYGGISTLPELEEIYIEGLKRFPGTFAEYHLSPDAIIPDRTQPVVVPGIPTILFQGICTARMLAGDWKKSYLALDTILRLYPTQTPPRFFELFMTERPIWEAYTAFMVACRAGIVISPGQVNTLIIKLRTAMLSTTSILDRIMILRAVANALYAYQEASGDVQSRHVGAFIHCFEHILPKQIPGQDFIGEPAQLRNIIVFTAHEIMAGLLQSGFSAQIHPFEALVSIAGHLRVPSLLTTTLEDIKAAEMDLGRSGTRTALTSAGLVKDKELIEQLWSRIVSAAEAEGAQIAFEDWITFTKACRRADLASYFREQLSNLSHTTTFDVEQHLTEQLSVDESEIVEDASSFDYMSVNDFASEMDGLKLQMKNLEAVLMSGSPLDFQKSPFYMHIDPSTTSISSLDNLQAVYDETTIDPHQPPAPEGSSVQPPALSSTKIPFDQLRFMNWVSVLELMNAAEAYDSALKVKVNEAIRPETPFKDNSLAFVRKLPGEPIKSRSELRDRIRALRNTTTSATPNIGKLGS